MAAEPQAVLTVVGTGAVLAGRYRLTGPLGHGGMSDVFTAEDQLLQRPVAVKLFRAESATSADRRRFEVEARTLAGLRHPGLVALFDAGTVQGRTGQLVPFLVMELIDGPPLSRRLADDGPLSVDQLAPLSAQLADTLAYVHARGVVHRDVKPANILLDAAPARGGAPFVPKLADFGISRLVDATQITQQGTLLGTLNYLSPEQAAGALVGPPSDVYSLGLVLIECLTGRPAYPGSGIATAVARLHSPPAVPTEPGSGWSWLLTAMTAADPDARPTAVQVADALHASGADGPVLEVAGTASLTLPKPGIEGPHAASQAPPSPVAVVDPTLGHPVEHLTGGAPPSAGDPQPVTRRPPVLDDVALLLIALAAALWLVSLLLR